MGSFYLNLWLISIFCSSKPFIDCHIVIVLRVVFDFLERMRMEEVFI